MRPSSRPFSGRRRDTSRDKKRGPDRRAPEGPKPPACEPPAPPSAAGMPRPNAGPPFSVLPTPSCPAGCSTGPGKSRDCARSLCFISWCAAHGRGSAFASSVHGRGILAIPRFGLSMCKEMVRTDPLGWSRGGSNPGPPPCKGGALPAELQPPGQDDTRVGAPGLEPGTSALSGPRSNQLSYAPQHRRSERAPPAPWRTRTERDHGPHGEPPRRRRSRPENEMTKSMTPKPAAPCLRAALGASAGHSTLRKRGGTTRG